MTARTSVITISGSHLYISANLPLTYDAAGYADTDIIWTEIGQVENYGNHGVSATIVEFTDAATAAVAKLKGSKNYGTMAMTVGSIPSDAGQVIVEAAAESNNHYSIKMVYPDNEIHYMDVLVAKSENQDGAVNDVARLSVDMALSKRPVKVAAV